MGQEELKKWEIRWCIIHSAYVTEQARERASKQARCLHA
jgi:hypothetical protein